jgi:hypothetical protein
MSDHRMIAQEAIRLVNDVGEVDETEFSAFSPEMRSRTSHRFIAERNADQVSVRVET